MLFLLGRKLGQRRELSELAGASLGGSWKRLARGHHKALAGAGAGGAVRETFAWSWRRADFLLSEEVFQLHDVLDLLLDWGQEVSQDVDEVVAGYCDIPVEQEQQLSFHLVDLVGSE